MEGARVSPAILLDAKGSRSGSKFASGKLSLSLPPLPDGVSSRCSPAHPMYLAVGHACKARQGGGHAIMEGGRQKKNTLSLSLSNTCFMQSPLFSAERRDAGVVPLVMPPPQNVIDSAAAVAAGGPTKKLAGQKSPLEVGKDVIVIESSEEKAEKEKVGSSPKERTFFLKTYYSNQLTLASNDYKGEQV